MANVDLKFRKTFTPLDPLAVPLAFGANQDGGSDVEFSVLATLATPVAGFHLSAYPARSFSVFATLDPLVATFDIHDTQPAHFQMLATLCSPTSAISMHYDSNVIRNVTRESGMRYQDAKTLSDFEVLDFNQGANSRVEKTVDWQDGLVIENAGTLSNVDGVRLPVAASSCWQDGIYLQAQDEVIFTDLLPNRLKVAAQWQDCDPIYESSTTYYKDLLPHPMRKGISWRESKYLTLIDTFKFAEAIRLRLERRVRWQITKQPWWAKASVLPPQPPEQYQSKTNLDFLCKCLVVDPLYVRLNFGKKPCPDQLLDQKVYFIVNTLSLKRVSDNLPIEVFSASIGIDKGSWCWSFNAIIPYNQLVNVQPNISGPVEVELSINGIVWRVIVESFSENKQFAKTAVSITGRSKTAYLDSPYAPMRSLVQSEATTSRQMAEAELSRVGLVTGYTLDWQLVDALGWAMPENTWSYQDLTPIQVIQYIAEGAGGYVNSSTLGDSIIVLPDYSVPFWQWASATVDKTIPLSLIKTQSLKWTEKPNYNGVYVSGENTGVTGFVRRYGTDGGFQAPAFVNPMISAEAAARSKGTSILSSGGKQASVGLDLPMHEDLGLVTPGMLIEVDPSAPWRGIVRSTSIAAAWNNGLSVTQSIELERHYEDA